MDYYSSSKKGINNTVIWMNLQSMFWVKKPIVKDHMLYDSIYVIFLKDLIVEMMTRIE